MSLPGRWKRRVAPVVALTVLLALSGCGGDDQTSTTEAAGSSSVVTSAAPSTSSPAPTTSATTTTPGPATTAPTTPPKTTTAVPPPAYAGKVVVLDPGHNGANGANPSIINAPVPDGAGGTKPCNTTGTATNAGFAEHAFNWDVVQKIKAVLVAKGVKVVLTRDTDDGVGPCVDKRAAIGNTADAAAVISIHGDGSAAGNRGFFCITSSLTPAGPAVNTQSLALGGAVRDSVAAAGTMPISNYAGNDGMDLRADLAGLNLSTRPTTMCEMGNMRSDADAAVMSSQGGRSELATAIAAGILTFLT